MSESDETGLVSAARVSSDAPSSDSEATAAAGAGPAVPVTSSASLRARRLEITTTGQRPVFTEQTFQDGFQTLPRKRPRIPMPSENPFDLKSCKNASIKKTVKNKIRILKWLPKYFQSGAWRRKLPGDLAAGLTVGVMNIPQGLAYAQLANISPVYGLYTSFIPAIIYLIFGSSHHIAVGTFAVVSLMVGQVVNDIQRSASATLDIGNATDSGAEDFCMHNMSQSVGCGGGNSTMAELSDVPSGIEIAVTVTIVVGLMQVVMSIFRLGFVTMFLSEPLVSGYTTGAAFHVFTSQVRSIFGIHAPHFKNPASIFKIYIYIFKHISCTNAGALLTGLISGVALYILKYFNPRIQKKIKFPLPAELLIIIVVTFVSWQAKFNDRFNVDIVDCIPTGPPDVQFSNFGRLPWKDVIAPSVSIAVVAFAIAVSVGQGFAKKHEYTLDANQELLALGFSNIVGGCFSCIVCTASLSRSAVYEAVGAHTQFGSIFGVIIIIFVVFLIGPLFEPLPKAVLAAIIMVSLKGLFKQFKELKRLWNISTADASVWFVTWLATVIFGVDIGLAIGICYSLVIVLFRTSRPYYCVLGQAKGTDIYRDAKVYSDIVEVPCVKIFRFEASLYFANINYFIECLHHAVDLDPAQQRRELYKVTEKDGKKTSQSGGSLNRGKNKDGTPDEDRPGQVPLLAYESTLHPTVKACDEMKASRRRRKTRSPTFQYDSSDGEDSAVKNTGVRYIKARSTSATPNGASPSDIEMEDTLNIVVTHRQQKKFRYNKVRLESDETPAMSHTDATQLLRPTSDGASAESPPSHEQRQSVPDAEVGIQSAPPSVTERPLSAFSMASSQDEERVHYVILDFSPVNYIDSQAVAALTALAADYKSVEIELLLANCRYRVRQMLAAGGFVKNMGSDRLFVSVHDAVRYTQQFISPMASPCDDEPTAEPDTTDQAAALLENSSVCEA